MSGELTSILLSFQPDSPELEKRRDYDTKARHFVSQLSNIPSAPWSKGADTSQDVLSVRQMVCINLESADFPDTQPRRKFNSVRLRHTPQDLYLGREEEYTRFTAAWRFIMESVGTLPRDCGPYTAAICWKGVEGTG
jgi:hypothetical protein